jgi:acetyltransferase-like isoleucine patch superfamily enzyme
MYLKVEATSKDSATRKIIEYLSPFDLLVFFKSGGYGRIGKGSSYALQTIRIFDEYEQTFETQDSNLRIDIGRFNEFASDTKLHVGGEHNNYDEINIGFGNLLFKKTHQELSTSLLKERGVKIGHCNVISAQTLVLDGASIPTGCVIGAKSLVTSKSKLKNFEIHAGTPIKKIGDREVSGAYASIPWDRVNYGDLSSALKNNNMKSLAKLRSRSIPKGYLMLTFDDKSPKFKLNVFAYFDGKKKIESKDFPSNALRYFNNMVNLRDNELDPLTLDETLFH